MPAHRPRHDGCLVDRHGALCVQRDKRAPHDTPSASSSWRDDGGLALRTHTDLVARVLQIRLTDSFFSSPRLQSRNVHQVRQVSAGEGSRARDQLEIDLIVERDGLGVQVQDLLAAAHVR